VAILMDLLALDQRGRLPAFLTPHSLVPHSFGYTTHLLWTVWILAAVGLIVLLRRRRGRG
jgi:hypothetical protein